MLICLSLFFCLIVHAKTLSNVVVWMVCIKWKISLLSNTFLGFAHHTSAVSGTWYRSLLLYMILQDWALVWKSFVFKIYCFMSIDYCNDKAGFQCKACLSFSAVFQRISGVSIWSLAFSAFCYLSLLWTEMLWIWMPGLSVWRLLVWTSDTA